jgi:UDP-N-acetylmuramoylalanine--D-glutamate ligase
MITARAFADKSYAVFGLARSGLATVDALLASGAKVMAWDEREESRTPLRSSRAKSRGGGIAVEQRPSTALGTSEGSELRVADPLTTSIYDFSGVVVSPGVPINRHPIAARARQAKVPLIGDIELFAQARPELPPHKVVGITGTNGKSTTTALVHHIVRTAGIPTLMGGNIGLPILAQEPLTPNENGVGVYVLELSSFQIDLTQSLDCDVSVLLNITPDHLDRYDGMDDYAAAKARLFAMQSPEHAAVIAAEDDYTGAIAGQLDGRTILVSSADVKDQSQWPALQGPHNAQNVVAAVAVARELGIDDAVIADALRTYPGLPHRMERVREKDGVLFVNDSKATNPTSTAPALAAYPAIHWILGGLPKGDDLDACAPHFGHVRAAYTIGEAGPMFADLLADKVQMVEHSVTLNDAVRSASRFAKPGEVVLLSPACASFDQFKDYEARGEAFRAAVEALR